MFKVYFLLNSADDPFRYKGADAAAQLAKAVPTATGYVQCRATQEQISGRDLPDFNATAEFWFDYEADAVLAAQRGCGELLADGVEVFAVHCGIERVVMRTPQYWSAECIKGVYPFRRKQGMDVAAFQRHWWHTHGPIAALTEEALCYVQTHVLNEYYEGGEPHFDGITELHWLDTAAANRAATSRQMVEDQGSDALNFVDIDSVQLLLVQQQVIVAP